MDWTLEVVVVPFSDLDTAIEFYRDAVGFHLDNEVRNEHMAFARQTPSGSGCSIVIGTLPSPHPMEPGSLHGVHWSSRMRHEPVRSSWLEGWSAARSP